MPWRTSNSEEKKNLCDTNVLAPLRCSYCIPTNCRRFCNAWNIRLSKDPVSKISVVSETWRHSISGCLGPLYLSRREIHTIGSPSFLFLRFVKVDIPYNLHPLHTHSTYIKRIEHRESLLSIKKNLRILIDSSVSNEEIFFRDTLSS